MTMCVHTPLEHHPELRLWVKREDMSCPTGPHFSKTRGVWAHVFARNESLIGVLDTSHSQGGWAVAQACALLNRQCVVYYPVRKSETFAPLRPQQQAARQLGARLVPLPAGRSAILYHSAKRLTAEAGGYMMPNALKLPESVEETRKEVICTDIHVASTAVVSASSGTIAAGLLRGMLDVGWFGHLYIHFGYSRSAAAVTSYLEKMVGSPYAAYQDRIRVHLIDEGYSYADSAHGFYVPPFPCNPYYDLKALRWFLGHPDHPEALFWNIG